MKVIRYSEEHALEWDEFVMNQSVNGTFLQTRRSLNYHPGGRFVDESLMVYNEKQHLIAVVPGCRIQEKGEKIYFSHKGSTFGGVIISTRFYKAKYVDEVLTMLKQYWMDERYQKVVLKQTSEIFCVAHNDLIDYVLYKHGFQPYYEINTYIDYKNYKPELLSNLAQGKRTNVHNCVKAGMYVKPLERSRDYRFL